MTTIAFDGKSLCSDSLLSVGDMRLGSVQKVFKEVVEGRVVLYAGSGNHANWHAAMNWLVDREGDCPVFDSDSDNDFTLIEVTGPFTAFYYGPSMRLTPAPLPYVVAGSGEAYALAALTLGKTAREAVELAIKLDCSSGGEIQEETLED